MPANRSYDTIVAAYTATSRTEPQIAACNAGARTTTIYDRLRTSIVTARACCRVRSWSVSGLSLRPTGASPARPRVRLLRRSLPLGDGWPLGARFGLLRLTRNRVRLEIVVEHGGDPLPTNKEIVEAAYASFATGDVPAVLAIMDPKIEWTEAEGFPLYDGTLVGPQAIVDGVFMRLGEIGDNFSVRAHQIVADGDTVAVLGTYSWNHKSSGTPAEVKMVHVWTLADGKLIRFQQHVDTARVRDLIA